jgi:hypothetical protein
MVRSHRVSLIHSIIGIAADVFPLSDPHEFLNRANSGLKSLTLTSQSGRDKTNAPEGHVNANVIRPDIDKIANFNDTNPEPIYGHCDCPS